MKQKKEKVETPKFYTLNRILSKNADYNVILVNVPTARPTQRCCMESKNICAQVNKWLILDVGGKI